MKGDISAITQAVMLGVIMAVIITVSLGLVLVLNLKSALGFGGGQIEHEFEIIGISNKPYSLAEGLTAYKPNDRSFLENAIEAAVVNGLPRANAQNIQAPVKQFLEFFGLKSYQVTIQKGQLSLLTVNSFVAPCGEGKGICTTRISSANECGEGRVRLPDNSCSTGKVCCSVEISGDVKKCGTNLDGVCTGVSFAARVSNPCGEGREAISHSGVCAANEACCKYIDVSEGVASKAEVPLIYEGKLAGILRVETSIR